MKKFFSFVPIIFCSLLMAAHFGRANLFILQIITLIFPFILIWKNKISARIIQILLVLYGLEWIRTIFYYARIRTESGEDWFRLAVILGVVAVLNFASIFVFRTENMKKRYEL